MYLNKEAQLLKEFEPAMHKLLQKSTVKKDYEDNLQELRIAALIAIRSYKPNKNTTLFTYVYCVMKNRLLKIHEGNYRLRLITKEDGFSKEFKKTIGYDVVHSVCFSQLTYPLLMSALENCKITSISICAFAQ